MKRKVRLVLIVKGLAAVPPMVTVAPVTKVRVLRAQHVVIGGSIVKPCISGTVQKTAGTRATLAFAIFYMVINIGSLFGRGTGYLARTNFGLSAIFVVAMGCSIPGRATPNWP